MAIIWNDDENSTEDEQKDCDYAVEIPENFPEVVVEDSVHALLYTKSGARIPVNFVKKSVMSELRKKIGNDEIFHGQDFSVNMRQVCFVQIIDSFPTDD